MTLRRPRLALIVAELEPTQSFVHRDLSALSKHCDVSLHTLWPTRRAYGQSDAKRAPTFPLWSLELWRRNARVARRTPGRYSRALWESVRWHWWRPRDAAINLALFPIAMAETEKLRAEGVEQVHAFWANHSATAARACAHVLGVPYSMGVHAWDLLENRRALGEKCRGASIVVACSESARRRLHHRVRGLEPGRVRVCRHGLELSELPVRAPKRSETRPLVFCVARLVPKKGLVTLLEALHELASGGQDFSAVIAGPDPDARHAQMLHRAARGGAAHEKIHFAGWMDASEVQRHLEECAVYVQPSRPHAESGDTDGIPNALLEAMAAGAPIVATACGGIPEVVSDGVTGLLVDAGNASSLAQAIQQTLRNPSSARRRAAAARRIVEQRHSLRHTGERLAAALFAPEHAGSSPARP